jgi:predicted signal transduction protein with EAL and GGDEF domain
MRKPSGYLDNTAAVLPVALIIAAMSILEGLLLCREAGDRRRFVADLTKATTGDPLTGVSNHRWFIELAERELSSSARGGSSVCRLLRDVDHFERVNDDPGHNVGDLVLVEIARTVEEQPQRRGIFARRADVERQPALAAADERQRALPAVKPY